ncbi:MAG: hypothetical protein HYY85_00135 [Deltaproteobacteria bacterium]|nr:hypothetical protein [Deltaproteobacteria bacterium]
MPSLASELPTVPGARPTPLGEVPLPGGLAMRLTLVEAPPPWAEVVSYYRHLFRQRGLRVLPGPHGALPALIALGDAHLVTILLLEMTPAQLRFVTAVTTLAPGTEAKGDVGSRGDSGDAWLSLWLRDGRGAGELRVQHVDGPPGLAIHRLRTRMRQRGWMEIPLLPRRMGPQEQVLALGRDGQVLLVSVEPDPAGRGSVLILVTMRERP